MDDDILNKIREDFRIYEVNPYNPNTSSCDPLLITYEKTVIEATVPARGIRYHLICLMYEILRKLKLVRRRNTRKRHTCS